MKPRDWEHCDREVLVHNLFFSTDKPNLRHIFPTNSEYVLKNQHNNVINNNTLLNIAYLTQITNLDITKSFKKRENHLFFSNKKAAAFAAALF
jgi:hypothetical protein